MINFLVTVTCALSASCLIPGGVLVQTLQFKDATACHAAVEKAMVMHNLAPKKYRIRCDPN
jgi:hypothetical protein